MPITPLPTPPSRSQPPATFANQADAFLAALPTFAAEANALAIEVNQDEAALNAAVNSAATSAAAAATRASNAANSAAAAATSAQTALNAPGTSGTSTTSLAVGTGSRSFTTQTGKAWVVGQPVVIARTSAPATTWMYGVIASYNSGNGAMVVSVSHTLGSGTATDWTISLTGPMTGVDITDIGTAPNQIPLNGYLGTLAYQNAEAVTIRPQASVTPAMFGEMVFQLTNDTTLVVKVKGSDGVVRSATLTLA